MISIVLFNIGMVAFHGNHSKKWPHYSHPKSHKHHLSVPDMSPTTSLEHNVAWCNLLTIADRVITPWWREQNGHHGGSPFSGKVSNLQELQKQMRKMIITVLYTMFSLFTTFEEFRRCFICGRIGGHKKKWTDKRF